MKNSQTWAILLCFSLLLPLPAAVRYVNVENLTPIAPYTNWVTAATSIQEAIDAAGAGDLLLVTNGVYQTGGLPFNGLLTNRVAVTKPLEVRSVNGPAVTQIRGYREPRYILAPDAIRCVSLTAGAVLCGFTLSEGATMSIWGSPPQKETQGGGIWCESPSSIVSNCVIVSNSAGRGGGAAGGTFYNCVFSGNSASEWGSGGGAYGSTLNNCTLTGNSAPYGGGVESCSANNCIIFYNQAGTGPNHSWSEINYSCTTPLPVTGTGNFDSEPLLASTSHLSSGSPCRAAGSASYAVGSDVDGELWATPPSVGCDEYRAGGVTGPLRVSIQAAHTNVPTGFQVRLVAVIAGRCSDSRWEWDDGSVVSNRLEVTRTWSASGLYPVTLRTYNETFPAGITATQVIRVLEDPIQYVAVNSLNPIPPYTSWATAANNIQDALDAAFVNGTILVSNGVYQAGGRAVYGSLTNRAAVLKPLSLRSVNGPEATMIRGFRVPGNVTGDSAIRCVYLTNGATLSGFTLVEGSTLQIRNVGDNQRGNSEYNESGGGVWCETSALVTNCVFLTNTAARAGGGAWSGALANCLFRGNSANTGGGAAGANLGNCALTGNFAIGNGGGVSSSTLNQCTLTGNWAHSGGGAESSTLNNCIIWFNEAVSSARNTLGCNLSYCCTPDQGSSNLPAEPQLADPVHLSASSPCRGSGDPAFAKGADIDGESWAALPSIGCDEFHNATEGALEVAVQASYNTVSTGYPLNLSGFIKGHASSSLWEFGDGTFTTNQPYTTHTWGSPGVYEVVLRAFNGTNPFGVAATSVVHVVARPTHYANAAGANPVPPFTSWVTAAVVLQDAIDAAVIPGSLVLVSNGVYLTGGQIVFGSLSNRVALTRPITLQSVNGPALTTIQGNGTLGDDAVRCVYLTNGAALVGFTITNGTTRLSGELEGEQSGGGIWSPSTSALVSNCVIIANTAAFQGGGVYSTTLLDSTLTNNSVSLGGWGAGGGGVSAAEVDRCVFQSNSAPNGGGAAESTIRNSRFLNNSAKTFGGGANDSSLFNCLFYGNIAGWGGGANGGVINNCTLVYNSADWVGGGADNTTLNNCISYYNYAGRGSHNYGNQVLNYCCTTPAYGTSISGPPVFVNASAGDFRPQATSPVINSGHNAYVGTAQDLGNQSRIAGGTIDMGAFEYQSPASSISHDWLQKNGFPLDGSADALDPDADHHNNWQEWIAGTDPRNQGSALRLLTATGHLRSITVRWTSVTERTYFLERATNTGSGFAFSVVATNILGVTNTTAYSDTNLPGQNPSLYRVGVSR